MKRRLLIAWIFLQLYMSTLSKMDAMTLRGIHLLFVLSLSGLFFIDHKKLSYLFAGLSVSALGAFIYLYPQLSLTGGRVDPVHLYLGLAIILLLLLMAFKVSRELAYICLFFLSYLWWGQWVPGILGHGGFSLYRLCDHMVWGSQGIFGLGAGVSMSYIFLFVIYGALLKESGFIQMIYQLSHKFLDRSQGACAKMAILASGLLGMMNGSAVANVATTGTLTIPLMKKSGYSSEYAAAVESAASTGGQFCPPIMGAVGFVMAEYLSIPYSQVMVAGALPAALYYASLFIQVHYEAKKTGIRGDIAREDFDPWDLLPLLSILCLIVLMVKGYTPIYSVLWAILVLVVTMQVHPRRKFRGKELFDGLEEGGRMALKISLSCILIGLLIGSVTLSGFGINFGHLVLSKLAGNSLILGGVFVMVLSVILGMGVPGVAAYIIVASVAVPVLLELGAPALAAHMFCLYYAVLSNITPPVAISCYMASSLAGSNPWKTGLLAIKIGLVGFILPFLFLLNPILLGLGSWGEVFLPAVSGVLGTFTLSVSLSGFFKTKLSKWERGCLFIAGLGLMVPGQGSDLLGLGLGALVYVKQMRRWKVEKA